MRVAYLNCFAGIAGDMFLGALIDAGVPASVLQDATASLGLEANLEIERVDRSGISCTKVHVLEGGHLADTPGVPFRPTHTESAPHSHTAGEPEHHHQHDHDHDHDHDQHASHEAHAPKHSHKHDHKHGHTHQHDHDSGSGTAPHAHPHVHGRSLSTIRQLIAGAPLADEVKDLATRTFELLGASEARIHNVPVESIHFHEVGAVDAIVDIVATCAGIHHLRIEKWFSSPLNVGSGMVQCAHGNYPVPAPATADLLRDVPTYAAHVQKELVTPTGAALIRALSPTFGDQPAMRTQHIGYGAGSRNPAGFPNVLRLSVGDWNSEQSVSTSRAAENQPVAAASPAAQAVAVLEAAIDDASPQLLAFVAEQALAHGALDVTLTPTLMKKGRPGTLVAVLCQPHETAALTDLLLRESPTLGVRSRIDQRICLDRRHTTADTPYGTIRIKIGSAGDQERNAAPEFEDCKAAALAGNVPLKRVHAAALAAYYSNEAATS